MSYGGGDECDRCKKMVYFAEEVRSEGGRFHKSCFVCCSCRKCLDSTTVASHDNEIYCKSCHGRKFGPKGYGYGGGSGVLSMDRGTFALNVTREEPAPPRSTNNPNPSKPAPRFGGADRCARCGKYVYANEKVIAAGNSWHKLGCFSCALCGKSLESTTLTDKDGEIYCKGCYGKEFGPKGYGYGGGAGALTLTK